MKSMTLKSILKNLLVQTKNLLDDNTIFAIWYKSKTSRNNWGDVLNPLLIREISGKKPVLVREYPRNIRNKPVYSVIGSILGGEYMANYGKNRLVVWGTGFISNKSRLKTVPREICAVRGPLTREIVKKQGYHCPEVYGDPALLYPMFYKPLKPEKKYKLGIIPHYVDKKFIPPSFREDPDVLLIDIQGPINRVVDEICSCEMVASSSLHGIIASDAYGIPSSWIRFSDKIVGGDFKYHDYFHSVGRTEEQVLNITEETSVDDILESNKQYKLDFDVKELWDACPFRHD
jgi:pyruvyltransferase